MSGSTATKNIQDVEILSSASALTLLARRGAGELVGLDPAAIEGSGGSGTVGPAGPAGATGATGPAGADGKSVLNGSGVPSNSLGQNGDYYLDQGSTERFLYGPKAGGVWPGTAYPLKGPQGDTGATGPAGSNGAAGVAGATGPAGNTILSGTGGPSNALGVNGDYYLDRASADYLLYGPKTGGAWPLPGFPLKGSGDGPAGPTGATGAPGEDGTDILLGSGVPSNALGKTGDVYVDTASADRLLYGPKTGGVWPGTTYPLRGPIGPQGIQGVAGSQGIQGIHGNAGAAGASVRSGSGVPGAGVGANGDFYIDLTSVERFLYGPKAGGVWPGSPLSLRGLQGIQGVAGPAGADASLGNTAPVALGATAAAGTATTAARSDHRHIFPTAADVGAAPAAHGHSISTITGLQLALDGKASVGHAHAISDVTGLTTGLSAKQDISAKGLANGYASLGSDGKVPTAQLPSLGGGGGSTANLDNGTADGQVAVWNQAEGKYKPESQISIVRDRDPVVERNAATALTFNDHHRRIIVLSANAPLTLASTEIGIAPFQGITFLIENDHTATNTITFGAGITVKQPTAGTGTSGQVKIPADGQMSVVVYPKGSGLIAKCRGDVA